MKKKIATIVIVLVFAALSLFAGGEKEFNYQVGDFDKFVEETKTTTNGMKSLSNDIVVKKTKEINSLVSDLKTSISNDRNFFGFLKSDTRRFDEYLGTLQRILDFQSDIIKNKDKVRSQMYSYIGDIESLGRNLNSMLTEQKSILKDYQYDLAALKRKVTKDRDYERDLIKYQTEISCVQSRISMIETYKSLFGSLDAKLLAIREDVDCFLKDIEASYDVYSEVYKTAKLSRDLNNAYNTIVEFDNLEQLSKEIQQSWVDLDYIITSLTSATNSRSLG